MRFPVESAVVVDMFHCDFEDEIERQEVGSYHVSLGIRKSFHAIRGLRKSRGGWRSVDLAKGTRCVEEELSVGEFSAVPMPFHRLKLC